VMGRVAWVVLGCVALLTAAGQAISVVAGLGMDLAAIAFLAFPAVGAVIVSREPRNAIGWVLLGIGVSNGLADALGIYAHFGLTIDPASLPGPAYALALSAPLWVPAIGLPGTFLILLFPDGRLPSGKWRAWSYFCAGAMVVCYTTLVVLPYSFSDFGYPDIRNPLAIDALRPVVDEIVFVVVSIPIAILGCAVALIKRFRRSRGVARLQMRWLAGAAAVVALMYLALMALHVPSLVTGREPPGWVGPIGDIGILAFVLLPVAVGIAVLRYRLYEIDLIINRALVYGTLTATLGLVYAAGVIGGGGLLRDVSGGGSNSFVVAASTLAVAALFRPARGRIQGFIDRRFYRRRYDATRTVEAFASRLRDEIDLEALRTDLVAAVQETMQPRGVSIWLRS
jgi:hypothetical protein